MARGDTFNVNIPGIGWHMTVVLQERGPMVLDIFGQTQAHLGAHVVSPRDPVAAEFGGQVFHPTHFHKNNLALLPKSLLPQGRMGHIDDAYLPNFVKAAKPGLVALTNIEAALAKSNGQCECPGACKKHEAPCPTITPPGAGFALTNWKITPKGRIFCRACW